MFNFTGQERPEFAIEPGPGQESVWDYPRPPTFYLPHDDIFWDRLIKVPGSSVCEWKGAAQYRSLVKLAW